MITNEQWVEFFNMVHYIVNMEPQSFEGRLCRMRVLAEQYGCAAEFEHLINWAYIESEGG